MAAWIRKRVLITVRTYPVPAKKGVEVSCTAGVTGDGEWIRLFPIPYRFLEEDKRFKKYQWIDVDTLKATNDSRPESHKLRLDSISITSSISTENQWSARWDVLRPLVGHSFCALQRARDNDGHPTLGLIKPAKITRLIIEKTSPVWNSDEVNALNQLDLFQKSPSQPLEKLPIVFKYDFHCEDSSCAGHQCTCTDWEMGQSYRRWRRDYGDDWEDKFRQRFETEMIDKYDTYFYVGNLHQFPNAWIVVGLFYPPKRAPAPPDLFG